MFSGLVASPLCTKISCQHNLFFFFFLMCLNVWPASMSEYCMCAKCPQGPEEGNESPEAGFKDMHCHT